MSDTVQITGDSIAQGIRRLVKTIKKDFKGKQRGVQRAIRRTAREGVKVARGNVPVAFAELKDSVHAANAVNGAAIIADAPHAGAVENGSRPHTPPLEPLMRWVKLRGMQGLQGIDTRVKNKIKKGGGATLSEINTAQHASHIAAQLRAMGFSRHSAESGMRNLRATGSSGEFDEAVKKIAIAIQAKISKSGTKPHAFMRESVPTVEAILDAEIKVAMNGKPEASSAEE